MASFAASDVKKLRDATGAGMMDAKKALTEADGDFDKAVEVLRVSGQAKAAKRGSEREASNGLVASQGSALIQLGAETDFVAKNDEFVALADAIASAVDQGGADDVESALAMPLASGGTVAEGIQSLAAKIGEKLELKGVARFDGSTTVYLHRRASDLPPQVGVLVEYDGQDETLVRSVAMQVAAMRPAYVTREEVPAETVANERRIAEATAREEGKPEQAIARIVEGRLNGYYKDVVLVDQPYVSDDKKSVGQVLQAAGVSVSRFARFEAAGS
ncbi:translation elongation factor Ts [Auraticoccus monumenti]|uniref:Elongation factor Ts n=1 Tax=Auraticoccus monumenti TaxID=675864 RepID=A0A1G7DCH2_9ACTN|nr:translation elongation factor Ts [Auraticoccus monumenti]SDE48656.1 translation elongation factor Ts (EF-Ts) [Auraticoccus monumenti]